jgi:hypothetical protein
MFDKAVMHGMWTKRDRGMAGSTGQGSKHCSLLQAPGIDDQRDNKAEEIDPKILVLGICWRHLLGNKLSERATVVLLSRAARSERSIMLIEG